jgi:hypothetical protein
MRKYIGAGTALVLASVALPMASHADSNYTTGSSTITATGHLNFQIVIPQVLYVRVSTGTAFANNGTIDSIVYTVPGASVGNSTAINGVGGDLTAGQVTAQVIGNGGTVTFSSSTAGQMNNGTSGQNISYTQISTAVAAYTALAPTTLLHPTLADGASTSETLTPVNGVVNQAAKWTFTYLNTTVPASGTYGGTVALDGQATYTASMP